MSEDLKKTEIPEILEVDKKELSKAPSLTYEDKVIRKIASISTSNIDGILAMSGGFISGITDKLLNSDTKEKGISVEVGKKQVAVDLKVICEYGKNIPQIYDTTVKTVTDAIKGMTGLDVIEVNMHVDDIMTKEEYDGIKAKNKDTQSVQSATPRVD